MISIIFDEKARELLKSEFTVHLKVSAPVQLERIAGGGFKPFRRNINYFEAKRIDVKPLVPLIPFIKNKNSWGYVFSYGFLEIDQESFGIIAHHMLGLNPLLQENR